MRRLLFTALALLALAPSAHAQGVEDYNSKTELKGLKKIFINPGRYRKDRERILKVLKDNARKLPGVEVVTSAADAEVILYYSAGATAGYFGRDTREPVGTGEREPVDISAESIPTGSSYETLTLATGEAEVPDKLGGRRVVLRFDGSKVRLVDWPSTMFAKAFVKAWVKANK